MECRAIWKFTSISCDWHIASTPSGKCHILPYQKLRRLDENIHFQYLEYNQVQNTLSFCVFLVVGCLFLFFLLSLCLKLFIHLREFVGHNHLLW